MRAGTGAGPLVHHSPLTLSLALSLSLARSLQGNHRLSHRISGTHTAPASHPRAEREGRDGQTNSNRQQIPAAAAPAPRRDRASARNRNSGQVGSARGVPGSAAHRAGLGGCSGGQGVAPRCRPRSVGCVKHPPHGTPAPRAEKRQQTSTNSLTKLKIRGNA